MTASGRRDRHVGGAGTTSSHHVETVIVGAGQAGLALSRSLALAGHDHVVLERGVIAHRWRHERWDSLSLLTPNWLNRLPGQPPHGDRNGFLSGRAFADSLDEYAWSFLAPVVEGVSVRRIEQRGVGFRVLTDRGTWRARNVVDATGDCAGPIVPSLSGAPADELTTLHVAQYRSADALPEGGVLVVGAGASGQQLALELAAAGRPVVLAVGRHARAPRRYRGRDIWSWLDELGDLERTIDQVGDPDQARRTPSFALSGGEGGRRLDLDVLVRAGVRLTGRLTAFDGRHACFADDLRANIADAEGRLERLLDRIDARADTLGVPASERPSAVTVDDPPSRLDLGALRVSTVVWATGYRRRTSWLPAGVTDGRGAIVQRRGATRLPGLYVLGLRYQHRRSSHFIGGVGADASYLARAILGRQGSPRRAAIRAPRPRAAVGALGRARHATAAL
jgi:putative flavoprotein involved in K+ transport